MMQEVRQGPVDRRTYDELVEAVRKLDPERVVALLVEAEDMVASGLGTASHQDRAAQEAAWQRQVSREVERLALEQAVGAGLDSADGS